MKNDSVTQRFLYQRFATEINQMISIRQMTFAEDLYLLHEWMQYRHIAPFWKLDIPLEEFKDYLDQSIQNPNRKHYMVYVDKQPISYVMLYNVRADHIRNYYDYDERDLGAHFVIGPRYFLDKKYIKQIFNTILSYTLQTFESTKMVVEPDVRNRIVIPALKECGFQVVNRIQLPHKKAYLMVYPIKIIDQKGYSDVD
ncbi:GNAT family N-acetyltransferase [Thermoflavimicrobium daqui]|uniref:Lysine N-acyltransferase MbtK n=1 Tax=Thermoflavimicrobium daqui TaxID=2137476 RepID=A0A364K0K1_9BACL|nr:GNAT family N-acetyltransferase [Thermoflavimicrobium daqui]RAL21031.1 hypothetical protein DL897_17515 [Thermoflavimicrobium daqui]